MCSSCDEVVALALEALVRSSPDVDVEVAVAAAPGPDRAEAAEAQGRAGVDAGRDVDRVGLLARSAGPRPGSRRTACAIVLAVAAAAGARAGGDHLAEDRLADPAHLAGAAALGAGLRVGARRRAGGLARVARRPAVRTDDRRLGAEHGLLEVEVDRDLEVAAPGRTGPPRPPAAEGAAGAAEERLEDVADARRRTRTGRPPAASAPSGPNLS